MQGKRLRKLIAGALVALLAAAGAPGSAAATHWAVAAEQSRIFFDYLRNSKPAEGQFTRFAGDGSFDETVPQEATLELHIDSASIDLGDTVESAFATSAEWFDSVNHPDVVYLLSLLTPEGDGRYRADGTLTIRGKTRPITTTINLDIHGLDARATGTLRMDRKDFGLGVGPSALFVDIGREVAVRFELTAHPAQH